MKFTYVALAASVLSLQAHAERLPVDTDARLSLGVNLGYTNHAYKADNTISISPQGFYDNNRWYIEGGEAGFYPYKDSKHHSRVGIAYDGGGFDADDAHGDIKGLNERKVSVMAHLSHMYITPVGGLKAKIATDALGRHDGTAITLSHISRFKKDDFTIYPSFGVVWRDKNYNDYYYGVSTNETTRTGIPTYQAGSGFNPFVSAMVYYDLNSQFELFVNGRVEWLSSAQKNSPIVDGSVESVARFGVNYKF